MSAGVREGALRVQIPAAAVVYAFGALVFIALYLQEGRGLSALTSGLTTFPEAVAIGLSAQVVSCLYPRVGPRRLLTSGFCGLAVVNGFLALAGAQTNLWLVRTLVLAVGGDHQVRAPVPAFHAVFAVTAGMGLLGAMFALGIHDSDAEGTMTREGKADHPDEDQRLADRRP
jgi:hypothetical protein